MSPSGKDKLMEKRYQQKQTRAIPTSKTYRPKSFDVQRSSLQPKEAGPSRLQNKPEAARASMSNPNDLKSKSGKHSASKYHDAIQQVNQTTWKKQQHNDHGASNSRQRQNSSAQLGWRQAMRRHSSMSSLGGRSFNLNLRRKLAGGGGPDDSSSQPQKSEGKEKNETSSQQSQSHDGITKRIIEIGEARESYLEKLAEERNERRLNDIVDAINEFKQSL
jgi:hypothetical protein